MKDPKALVTAAVLSALWAAAPASAIPITDFVDPSPDILISPPGGSYTYVHDITNDGFALADTINSASVTIHLTDTGGSELYSYTIGLGQTESHMNVGASTSDTHTLIVSSLADLQLDGIISITITHTGSPGSSPPTSFSFADSTLTAEVTRFVPVSAPNPDAIVVPEPSTLLLLGAGLAAFGRRIRRRW